MHHLGVEESNHSSSPYICSISDHKLPNGNGLKRRGKSCRLRWTNYLSPNVKHGGFSEEEDDLIIRLHKLLGNKFNQFNSTSPNRWSLIAGRVPGRTDNQVKNHWNTHLRKKLIAAGGVEKGETINIGLNSSQSYCSGDQYKQMINCSNVGNNSSSGADSTLITLDTNNEAAAAAADPGWQEVNGTGTQNSISGFVRTEDQPDYYDYEKYYSFWFSNDDDLLIFNDP